MFSGLQKSFLLVGPVCDRASSLYKFNHMSSMPLERQCQ